MYLGLLYYADVNGRRENLERKFKIGFKGVVTGSYGGSTSCLHVDTGGTKRLRLETFGYLHRVFDRLNAGDSVLFIPYSDTAYYQTSISKYWKQIPKFR